MGTFEIAMVSIMGTAITFGITGALYEAYIKADVYTNKWNHDRWKPLASVGGKAEKDDE